MLLGAFEFLNIFDGCEIKKITSVILSKMFVLEFKNGESDSLANMNKHHFEDQSWVNCNTVVFSYLIHSIKLFVLKVEFNPQVFSFLIV